MDFPAHGEACFWGHSFEKSRSKLSIWRAFAKLGRMNSWFGRWLLFVSCAFVGCAQQVEVTPDHADGVYKLGETVRWRVSGAGENYKFNVKQGGLTEITNGVLQVTDGTATIEAKLNEPGTLLATVTGAGRSNRALGGAVFAPEKIGVSTNRPADFDEFWAGKIKELQAIPANPKLEAVDLGLANAEYWKITMDNIRGTQIRGQIARPKNGEKFPALLIVQWAGVYPLQRGWVTNRAAQGWMALNIEAHDIPIDEPASFYAAQNNGALKGYPAIGNDDRETSYFLRMYLSCYRAAQYLTERPDWDGRTLVVTGDSQGGMQTFVTAGLHPKVTAGIPLVPAGCDLTGPVVGRAGGWPGWYFATQGKGAAKVRETSRYFDAVNFASRIKCPMLVGLGLIDETCPPAGVLAAINQLAGPKETMILVKSGHQDVRGTQEAFRNRREKDWLPALIKGEKPPAGK